MLSTECSGGSGHSLGIWFQRFYLSTLLIKCIQEKVLFGFPDILGELCPTKVDSHKYHNFMTKVDFLCSLPMCMLLVRFSVNY